MNTGFRQIVVQFSLCMAIGCAVTELIAADRIILRNLEIISDRTVLAFEDDGVTLDAAWNDGSKQIGWDEIERATISKNLQEEFDARLKELGTPLFRIRQRLRIGDYAGLREPAEALYPRFAARKSETAYRVCQAMMWSRLAHGDREGAVEPYLRCFEQLRSRAAKISAIPGERRLQVDPKTGFSPELMAVWFDASAAKRALPAVKEAWDAMQQPPPAAAAVYYATLAMTAGENAEADKVLAGLPTDSAVVAQWRQVARAQAEVLAGQSGPHVAVLRQQRNALAESTRPAAIYWLGMAALQAEDEAAQQDGVLELLSLPAVYGKPAPELAAAGLYQSMLALDKLKDDVGSAAIRKELLQNYAATAHAAKVRAAATPTGVQTATIP